MLLAILCKGDIYKCLKKYNNSSIVGAEAADAGSQALSPVLCYGSETMDILDVRLLLDMVVSGTVSTKLARRWECSLLVNVDNETLKALLNNPKATEALKKAKKEVSDSMSKTEKKELTQEEKEIRFKRNELGNLSVQTIQRNVPDLYGTEQTRKRTSWAVGYQNHGRRNTAGEKHLWKIIPVFIIGSQKDKIRQLSRRFDFSKFL